MEKTWDRVTMRWEFGGQNLLGGGIATSVTPEGNFDLDACSPKFLAGREKVHMLGRMEAISEPRSGGQRHGRINLEIAGCWYKGLNQPPQAEAISKLIEESIDRLTKNPLRKRKYGVRIQTPQGQYGMKPSWMETDFALLFVLDDGEKFCDTAIELVRAVLEGLGVHDERQRRLAGFTIRRDTFVKLDDNWIPFARWLRISNQLPIYGPEDM